ncbi:MAG: hypothetical protein ACI9UN_004987 [Granulosicoccus sp.]|jgi:hypothetical protein
MDFDFMKINDLPVLTATATSVFENGNVQITNQNLIITNPDLGFGNIVYNLPEILSHVTLEVLGRGPLLSTAATFTQVELNSNLVFYTPNVNNADDATYQIVFVATDPVPMDLVITGVNDTPALTTSHLVIEEGSEVVLTGVNFVVNDPNSSSQD